MIRDLEDEEARALIEFVRDEERGMEQVCGKNLMQWVVETLCVLGMAADALLERVQYAREPLATFEAVATWFAGSSRWKEFLGAIAVRDPEWWRETGLTTRGILSLFRGEEMVDYLLRLHRESIKGEEHPLFIRSGAVADTYWSRRVRQFIVRPDYERAWDELNKAAKGFLRADLSMADFGNNFEAAMRQEHRCWMASRSLIDELVRELHNAMADAGLIDQFTDEFYTLKDTSVGVTVYETKQPRAHRKGPRQYSQRVEVSGLRLALTFKEWGKTKDLRKQIEGNPAMRKDEGYSWDATVFTRPGGCVLIIAEYFRKVENERRRLKHQRALQEYEANLAPTKKPHR